jgi:hypothetical protein
MAYTSGRLFAGETAVTTVAAPVSTTSSNIREVIIQSDPDNTTNVLIGTATAQEVVLAPGQAITIPIISLSLIFVKMASSTGTVNWLARD